MGFRPRCAWCLCSSRSSKTVPIIVLEAAWTQTESGAKVVTGTLVWYPCNMIISKLQLSLRSYINRISFCVSCPMLVLKIETGILNHCELVILCLKSRFKSSHKTRVRPALLTGSRVFMTSEDRSVCSSEEILIVLQKGMAQSSRLLFCQRELRSTQLICSLHNKVNDRVLS